MANQAIDAFVSNALDSLPVDAEKADKNGAPLIEENYQQEDDLEWTKSVLDALAAAPLWLRTFQVPPSNFKNASDMAPPEGAQASTSEEMSGARSVWI